MTPQNFLTKIQGSSLSDMSKKKIEALLSKPDEHTKGMIQAVIQADIDARFAKEGMDMEDDAEMSAIVAESAMELKSIEDDLKGALDFFAGETDELNKDVAELSKVVDDDKMAEVRANLES